MSILQSFRVLIERGMQRKTARGNSPDEEQHWKWSLGNITLPYLQSYDP